MKILIIRQTGGTRGCGRGQNFGNVGNPQPTLVNGVQTTVEYRKGLLLLYAVEHAYLTVTSEAELTSLLDRGWSCYTMDVASGTNPGEYTDGRWIIPDNFVRLNGELYAKGWNERHHNWQAETRQKIAQMPGLMRAGNAF